MLKTIKEVIAQRKTKVSMLFFSVMMAMATSAFAAETGTGVTVDTAGVTGTFSSITTTVLTVIGTVAASAVTVMGVILAWKYGRKLFGMLAK